MDQNVELRDRRIGYCLLRIFLGVNIAIHGISRFAAGVGVFQSKTEQFAHSAMPHSAVAVFAIALPWCETILGLLILAGLWTRVALIGGALLMIVLTFGSGLIQDWQVAGIQLIYAIAYMLLLFLRTVQLLVYRYPAAPPLELDAWLIERELPQN